VEGWLEDGYAVVLEHVKKLRMALANGYEGSMTRSRRPHTVVFPALSSPRKSSLACLFARPKLASRSQTGRVSASCFAFHQHVGVGREWHTPVDDPHDGLSVRFSVKVDVW
jgi:hypothetical protein